MLENLDGGFVCSAPISLRESGELAIKRHAHINASFGSESTISKRVVFSPTFVQVRQNLGKIDTGKTNSHKPCHFEVSETENRRKSQAEMMKVSHRKKKSAIRFTKSWKVHKEFQEQSRSILLLSLAHHLQSRYVGFRMFRVR